MSRVSYDQAVAHLRRVGLDTGSPATQDADIVLKLAQAEAIIFDYLDDDAPDESPIINAAILIQFTELWRWRGDDETGPRQRDGYLSQQITNLLHRLRPKVIA